MDIKQAKENRRKFLASYEEKFRKSKREKERSKIISELIAIEPSHLTEPWIIKEVISWMRDPNCIDFLEEAFIKSPKKYALTEKQRINEARDFFVREHIDRIITEEGVSMREACRRFVLKIPEITSNFEGDIYLGWGVTDENYDLEKAIRQVYLNAKKKPEGRLLPWAYYGKDFEIDEKGKGKIFGGR